MIPNEFHIALGPASILRVGRIWVFEIGRFRLIKLGRLRAWQKIPR